MVAAVVVIVACWMVGIVLFTKAGRVLARVRNDSILHWTGMPAASFLSFFHPNTYIFHFGVFHHIYEFYRIVFSHSLAYDNCASKKTLSFSFHLKKEIVRKIFFSIVEMVDEEISHLLISWLLTVKLRSDSRSEFFDLTRLSLFQSTTCNNT